jgi:hypothetical protein
VPRKKTVQPDPIDAFTINDEVLGDVLVEVRGDGTWEIGRGQHMKNKYDEWFSEVLVWVADQYLTSDGPKRRSSRQVDILKYAAEFDRALQRSPFYPDYPETTSVRKRLYPDVVRHMGALTNAVTQNLNDKKQKN